MIRTWMDHLKPGERPLGEGRLAWCASRSSGGHVVKIVTGKSTREAAILAVGGTPDDHSEA
jgi:hypothetical protein